MIGELERRFGPFRDAVRIGADASVREFYRLDLPGDRTAVLMTDPAGTSADFDRMLAAHDLLRGLDVPVPAILDSEVTLSAALFEDFGETLLADALSSLDAGRAGELYEEAARIAARIARDGTPLVTGDHVLARRPLARERLRIELAFFATHDVAGRREVSDAGLLGELSRVLDRIAGEAASSTAELAHRDFHARNLLVRPDGRLGVVDFQDALLAPTHYDLASLLLDPYVELDEATVRRAADAYAGERGSAIDPREDPRFAWTGLQRLLKAIGTYAFQVSRRGASRFSASIAPAERRALRIAEEIPDSFSSEICGVLERLGFER